MQGRAVLEHLCVPVLKTATALRDTTRMLKAYPERTPRTSGLLRTFAARF